MPPKRKRGVALGITKDAAMQPPSLLDQIRNMEEFAALGQYLFMFGVGVLKLPDFGREELETELLAPQSMLIEQIQIALIRMVAANPRLVKEQFDEQARRQFVAMKPEMNPFGEEEVARPFGEMDLLTKIRVLHQLSTWTFTHPNQIREKMGDVDLQEELSWRMDHCGYDRNENIYYILDDNRLYRRAPFKETLGLVEKATQPKQRRGRKRRRVSVPAEESDRNTQAHKVESQGIKWSCVCITIRDWEEFVMGLKNSKDKDEEALYVYLNSEVLPEIRRAEDLRQKKLLELEKERQKQEAVANRKRSSRIDEKRARQKEEEEKAAEARKQEEVLQKAQAEERKREKEREARLAARERQNKERERRLQPQGVESSSTSCDGSVSGRRASARVQTRGSHRSQSHEDNDWVFDCRCGIHGTQYEDGSKIIACDNCDIWQHLACQNLPVSFIEGDFTCERCRRREAQAQSQAANSPRVTIKLRIGPQSKIPPRPPKGQDTKTLPSPTVPKIPDQQAKYFQELQTSPLDEPRRDTLLVSGDGDRDQADAKVQDPPKQLVSQGLSGSGQSKVYGVTDRGGGGSGREGSAQASADFLLLMADPGHGTPSRTTAETPNGVDISVLSHEGKFASEKPVPGDSTMNRLSSPGRKLKPSTDSSSPTTISSSGKNDTLSYHEVAFAQGVLAGPTTSANG